MSVKGSHVKIVTPELATMGTRIFVDDIEIAKVINVEYRHRAGELPIVLVEFYPESVEIEGEIIVVMAE